MRQIYLLLFVIASSFMTKAMAEEYYLRQSGSNITFCKKNGAEFQALTSEKIKEIALKGGLKIDRSGLSTATTVKIERADGESFVDVTMQSSVFRFANDQYTFIGGPSNQNVKILKITVTPEGGTPVSFKDIGKSPIDDDQRSTITYSSWREFYLNNSGGDLDIIKSRRRYKSSLNVAYICLDPYGNIIGKKPVNVDQDDEIIILMIVPDGPTMDDYTINDNDAEYAPNDLSIRPMESVNQNIINSERPVEQIKYTVKRFEKGPYTSENVTFSIMNGAKVLNEFTLHINPLYHLAIGVSYVSSNLESPSYQLAPLSQNTNTIVAANDGNRTFLVVNAIWYWWSTLKYIGGSSITRGRDVLKEPNFLTRINPTFGISLKGNVDNNFFTGFTFEFARGGSITGGWHYGRVNRLLNNNFELGVTEFKGTQSDIRTTEKWKWGGFFAVTLDSRILNRLFSARRSGE